MHRMIALAVVGSAAALLAACAGNANQKTFHASLTPSQEVPPTASAGTGSATVTLDTGTKVASWSVTYSGLTGPAGAAHIHGPAAPGANAGVIVNIGANGLASPIQGSATLTDAQVADLMGGKTYVNIHTAANKGGEIRGQLQP